jgi:hypothetical protein
MPTGLALPVQIGTYGRAKLVSGSELLRQLLLCSLRDCASENPFQDLGISQRLIFDINDAHAVGEVRTRIKQIFANFEAQRLAKLPGGDNSLIFTQSEEGSLDVEIKYLDLETDKPDTIGLTYSPNVGWK